MVPCSIQGCPTDRTGSDPDAIGANGRTNSRASCEEPSAVSDGDRGCCETDAAGRITFYNNTAVALWGRRPVLGQDSWCGSRLIYWPDGTRLPHNRCPMAVAIHENREVRDVMAVVERPDGTRVPFLPFPTPLHDTNDNLVGAVNVLVGLAA